MLIGVEEVAYQKALVEVLNRQSHPWTITPLKADKDKRRRAMAVTGMFQTGRVYLSSQDLIGQLKVFTGTPMDSADDLVDACVHALRLVQLYAYPGQEPPPDPRPHLTQHEKDVWDNAHTADFGVRSVLVDAHMGSEW